MELPIASQGHQTPPDALLRAMRQADFMLAQIATDPVEIDGAVLFINPRMPGVPMANFAAQLQASEGESPQTLLRRVLRHFESAGLPCHRLQRSDLSWPPDWHAAAAALGYEPAPSATVLRLRRWQAPEKIDRFWTGRLQILPGRALRGPLHDLYLLAAQIEQPFSPAPAGQWADWHLACLDEPRCEILAARLQGRIVGCLNVVSVGNIGVIDHAFTLPEYRGRGVTSSLLEAALDLCARAQHASVILQAPADSAVLRMYQRRGFVRVGEHQHYQRLGPSAP